MFVSTMFVILCVSLYLRDGGMQIRFMNAGVSVTAGNGSSTRGIAEALTDRCVSA